MYICLQSVTVAKSTKRNNYHTNMRFAILKADFLCICFGAVLSQVYLQLIWLFAGVVALLAGKPCLAGVWKHVILQTIVVSAQEVALLQIISLGAGIVTLGHFEGKIALNTCKSFNFILDFHDWECIQQIGRQGWDKLFQFWRVKVKELPLWTRNNSDLTC